LHFIGEKTLLPFGDLFRQNPCMKHSFLELMAIMLMATTPSFGAQEVDSAVTLNENVDRVNPYDIRKMTYGAILENGSTVIPYKRAYLYVDANGRPAIYPSPRIDRQTRRKNDLKDLSLQEIQGLWNAGSFQSKDDYAFDLTGWEAGAWQHFRVELSFENGKCRAFRVFGPHILVSRWMPTADIPEFDSLTQQPACGPKVLPWYVGLVEGPHDSSDCSVDPGRGP
jgi:hypothetical protein